jgi:membrane protein DedA with SNARE-associated domain
VGLFLLLESSGVPIVNSTLLLLTGALASLGHLEILPLALAAIGGSIAGACLAYTIGWYGGAPLLRRAATRLRLNTQKVESLEQWFRRAGARMIFFSRIIPYLRPFACFPAGMARMPFRRFFAAAASGSLVWCVGMLAIGWNLGHRWKQALHLMQQYTVPAILVIIVLVIGYFLVKTLIRRRLDATLQAMPGGAVDADSEGHNDRDLLEV